MVAPFPIAKLGILAIKQISKPLANAIKQRAKKSSFFRHYICMPPAQLYHHFDVNVKMRLMGVYKPREVVKLNEAMAIDLGAELLGEFVIFFVASITLTAEYIRQSRKAERDANAIEERYQSFEKRLEELEYLNHKQETEIRSLTRLIHAKETTESNQNTKKK